MDLSNLKIFFRSYFPLSAVSFALRSSSQKDVASIGASKIVSYNPELLLKIFMDIFFAILQFVIFCAFSLWILKLFKKPQYFFSKLFGYIICGASMMYFFPLIRRQLNILDYFFENPLVVIVGPLYYLIFLTVIVLAVIRKVKFSKNS